MRSDVGQHDFISQIQHQRLQAVPESAWRFPFAGFAIVRAERKQCRHYAEERRNPEHDDVPRRRNIESMAADMYRIPARQLVLARLRNYALIPVRCIRKARVIECVPVGDVRSDEVFLVSDHIRAGAVRPSSSERKTSPDSPEPPRSRCSRSSPAARTTPARKT